MQKDAQKSLSKQLWRHLWSLVMAVSKASSWYSAGLKRFVMEFQPDSCSCLCHTFPGFILAQRRWTIWLPSRHLIFRRSEDELLAKTTPWLHDLDKSCCECLNVMIFCDLASRKNIKSVCSSCIDVDLIVWGQVGRDANLGCKMEIFRFFMSRMRVAQCWALATRNGFRNTLRQ